MGASPFTYTAGASPEFVYIDRGTVTNVTRGGTSIATGSSATLPISVYLEPNQSIVVTYTAAPTMTRDVL